MAHQQVINPLFTPLSILTCGLGFFILHFVISAICRVWSPHIFLARIQEQRLEESSHFQPDLRAEALDRLNLLPHPNGPSYSWKSA
jgi:hypothetical protein